MKKFFVLCLALAMVAAACGDSDEGGGGGAASDDPRVEQIANELLSDDELPISQEEANCAASRVVNELSDDELQLMIDNGGSDLEELGLSEESGLKALDALLDCVDVGELMVAGMIADGTPEEDARCLASKFGENEIRELLELAQGGDEAAESEAAFELIGKMLEASFECGVDFG